MSGSALADDRDAPSGPATVDDAGDGSAAPPLDCEAILVALVLAPATYSRNRFFELYKNPEVRRARRRASNLRSLVRQLVNAAREGVVVDLRAVNDESSELSYHVPSLGLRRTVRTDALELAVLRFALGPSAAGLGLAMGEHDRARIDGALARLAPT